MDKRVRIGTRGSKLALWQAYHVEELLQAAGMQTEIMTIDTKGDKILDVSIAKIGSKGVFTEEIEDQLKLGTIDIAVHSAKDLQSELPEGFEILAFSEREKANDVFLGNDSAGGFEEGKEVVIGTSSSRRIAMLRHFYPKIKTVDMRGNLQTRIKKMESGACDLLMLAFAGVHRMDYAERIVKVLPLHQFTPAVGQGSIAIECAIHLDKQKKEAIRSAVNHHDTECCLLAERAFLKKLQGGCSIPVFAMAELKGGTLEITGGLISLDGKKVLRKTFNGSLTEASEIGNQLGTEILADGGEEMLKKIREEMQAK